MPNFKIYLFQKKNSVMEFLATTQGTEETPLTVRWPCKPIIFLIGHFEGPTEFQLKSWYKASSL